MSKSSPPPFLSLRTALILLLAFVCGTVVGVLAHFAGGNVAASLLAGLSAAGAALLGLNMLID